MLCFEDMVPRASQEMLQGGANLLVSLINASAFVDKTTLFSASPFGSITRNRVSSLFREVCCHGRDLHYLSRRRNHRPTANAIEWYAVLSSFIAGKASVLCHLTDAEAACWDFGIGVVALRVFKMTGFTFASVTRHNH